MNQVSENIIFQKVRNGDRQAFHSLFQIYYQPLFLFALKFVGEEQAKDIVQDCFYVLWQDREKIEISTSVPAYLFTMVKNMCYKYLKSEQKKKLNQHNFGLKLKQEELQYYINSEKSILEFAVKDRIERVINQMPSRCCEVFKKSRLEGFSNKEIAEAFNISVKAVEKHITKALQLFRDEFNDVLPVLLFLLFS